MLSHRDKKLSHWDEQDFIDFFDNVAQQLIRDGKQFNLKLLREEYKSKLRLAYRLFGAEKLRELFVSRYGFVIGATRSGRSKNVEIIDELRKKIESEGHLWSSLKRNLAQMLLDGRKKEIIQFLSTFGLGQLAKKHIGERLVMWFLGRTDSKLFSRLERFLVLAQIWEQGPNYKSALTLEILEQQNHGKNITEIAYTLNAKLNYIKELIAEAEEDLIEFSIKDSGSLFQNYRAIMAQLARSGKKFTPREERYFQLRLQEKLLQREVADQLGVSENRIAAIELAFINKVRGSKFRTIEKIYRETIELFALYTDCLKKKMVEECLYPIERLLLEKISQGHTILEIKQERIVGIFHPSSAKMKATAKMKKVMKEAGCWNASQEIDLPRIELEWEFGKIDEILQKLLAKSTQDIKPESKKKTGKIVKPVEDFEGKLIRLCLEIKSLVLEIQLKEKEEK